MGAQRDGKVFSLSTKWLSLEFFNTLHWKLCIVVHLSWHVRATVENMWGNTLVILAVRAICPYMDPPACLVT